ncbi:DUF951 family protein [Staphylococcus aureus]|uniref:DUF951 family protein n=1 Tax=Staphylococcus aureus TaxID=1280 RepID=UPI00119E1C8B|nr:DUF951 family protein [Staphylococcus aureus]
MPSKYPINHILQIKKQHPSPTNPFNIITIPTHITIKSQNSQTTIIIPPQTFHKKLKKIIQSHHHTQTYHNH